MFAIVSRLFMICIYMIWQDHHFSWSFICLRESTVLLTWFIRSKNCKNHSPVRPQSKCVLGHKYTWIMDDINIKQGYWKCSSFHNDLFNNGEKPSIFILKFGIIIREKLVQFRSRKSESLSCKFPFHPISISKINFNVISKFCIHVAKYRLINPYFGHVIFQVEFQVDFPDHWIQILVSAIALFFVTRWLLRKLTIGNYEGRHVVITGCDTGFGNMATHKFDALGFNVYPGCLTEKAVKELDASTSNHVHPFLLDVTKTESVDEAVKFVKSKLPAGTGTINNNNLQYFSMTNRFTVEPVLRNHLREPEKVPPRVRWSLNTG